MAGQVLFSTDPQQAGIAHVTLAHAGKFNAMSRAMWLQLRAVFETVQQDTSVRCVVVRGQDGHFCAGGDISEYPGFRFDPAQLAHFHENEVWGGLNAMLQCDVPIVAHIEGNCMGAGLEIASCCDLRLAASDAKFGAPIARLGFPMAPKEAALVGAAVGNTTARAMLLAAEVLDYAHMQAQGFLTRTLDGAELAVHVQAMARRIASLAPQAARMNKQTLRLLQGSLVQNLLPNNAETPVEYAQAATKVIANDASLQGTKPASPYAYADSAEHREGIAAFLDKRPPHF
jgi:enoyl-CoA hydratase/carnithine racemase